MSKKNGPSQNSGSGFYEMPSGLTHFAQSSAGELYVYIPPVKSVESGKDTKQHGNNKVNAAQLKGLYKSSQKKGD